MYTALLDPINAPVQKMSKIVENYRRDSKNIGRIDSQEISFQIYSYSRHQAYTDDRNT